MNETNILQKINSPADVKNCSIGELKNLSEEIRQVLINRITVTGGHMGSNLGFIEATVALHYVFESPRDKFVFDVSHQSYTHKILTGRKEGFTEPEKYYSLSGYTTPSESEHDNFKVGHTATSISLATGLAKGRDLNGGKENVIAVIGDGSMSGGEAFEGLNNAAMLKSNLIIVFNDNEMSIAENQGGMYENFKLLRKTNGKAENNFFKNFGLDYYYVDDGNNIEELISVFENVKDTNHPTVIHIHTLKGKGLDWAMVNKEAGHWALPAAFYEEEHIDESYEDLTAQYLLSKMKNDPTVVAVTAATPGATGLTPKFREKAGKQFVDVGIAEEHAVAFVSGIAKNGGKPVFEVLSSFLQRTYDQLNQDLAMNSNPATILVFGGGIGGGDCTHNGMYDIALISSIPNIIGLAPATKEEYFALLDWAVEQNKFPVVIRVPKAVISNSEEITLDEKTAVKGKIVKTGSKIAIIGLGDSLPLAMKAAELLEKDGGTRITVVNPICFTDLDKQLFDNLKKGHEIIATVEDGVLDGGFGQSVASYYGCDNIKVLNFGGEKKFNDLISAKEIAIQNHLTAEQIAEDIKKFIVL
ncbi:MAG: 1-deoxy-D-xylulose-5-phosphate synthase [Eubacterium sp.]